MRKTVWTLGIISCMLLTACGSKKQDNLKEEYNRVDSSVSSTTEGEAGVEKEFIIETKNELGAVSLNCKTDITSIDNVLIYDVDRQDIDEKYITDLAGKLFDDGVYEVQKPYGTMSNAEIETISRGFLDDGVYGSNANSAVLPLSYFKLYESTELEAGKIIAQTNTFGGAEECRLRGKMSGIEYELAYINVGGMKSISIYQTSTQHKYLDSSRFLGGIWQGGEPILAREEADGQVEKVMNTLGYNDFKLSSVCTRWCDLGDDKQDVFSDCGYVYTYRRNINGTEPMDYIASLPYVRKDTLIDVSDEESIRKAGLDPEGLSADTKAICTSMYISSYGDYNMPEALCDAEKIQIEIDDTGILSIFINAFETPMPRQNDDMKILSFSQCMDAAKTAIQDNFIIMRDCEGKDLHEADVYIRLTYQRIIQDEGDAYVPVLTFELMGDEEEAPLVPKDVLFGINVIDGSTISFLRPGKYERYQYEE